MLIHKTIYFNFKKKNICNFIIINEVKNNFYLFLQCYFLLFIFRQLSLNNILTKLNISENIFIFICNELIKLNDISCLGYFSDYSITLKSFFIPKIQMKNSEIYIKNFILSNGYIGLNSI